MKIVFPILLAVGLVSMVVWVMPAAARMIGSSSELVRLSTAVTGADLEANDDFAAVVFHSTSGTGEGIVYLKSASLAEGWLTSTPIGFGSQTALAFDPGATNKVYAVWIDGGGVTEKVKYAACTLDLIVPPSCNLGDVFNNGSGHDLKAADVVVGSDGSIHVAWENVPQHLIYTARASTSSPNSWTAAKRVDFDNVPENNPGQDGLPVLAWANNTVHLAFVRGNDVTQPSSVMYAKNSSGYDTWTGILQKPFAATGYSYISSRPTLAVAGNDVYVAWDAYDSGNKFGLMRATSTDGGASFGPVLMVTSDSGVTTAEANRYSVKFPANPPEEAALRPSMAISGSGFALVWQERPDRMNCDEFSPDASEIFYAYNTGTTWLTDMLDDNEVKYGKGPANRSSYDYDIAPDLAVPPGGPINGKAHYVFMRDIGSNGACIGGQYADYILYYWGPFTKTDRDQGEPGIYLPIVLKRG